MFFTKGLPTSNVWIYDGRSNVPKLNKTRHPLSEAHFKEFESCFGSSPFGDSERSETDSPSDRWKRFSIDEVAKRDFKLDEFKWLRDEDDDADESIDPEELLVDAIASLQLALDDLTAMKGLLGGNESE